MDKQLRRFDQLLSNPLWSKETNLPEDDYGDRMIKYKFEYSRKSFLVFFVNLNSRLVTGTAYPKRDSDFHSGVKDFDSAYKIWFAPFLWNEDTVKFVTLCMKKLDSPSYGIDLTVFPYKLMINFNYGEDYYTILLGFNESGGLISWEASYYYNLHPPEDDDIRYVGNATFEEFNVNISKVLASIESTNME